MYPRRKQAAKKNMSDSVDGLVPLTGVMLPVSFDMSVNRSDEVRGGGERREARREISSPCVVCIETSEGGNLSNTTPVKAGSESSFLSTLPLDWPSIRRASSSLTGIKGGGKQVSPTNDRNIDSAESTVRLSKCCASLWTADTPAKNV